MNTSRPKLTHIVETDCDGANKLLSENSEEKIWRLITVYQPSGKNMVYVMGRYDYSTCPAISK